MDKWSSDIRSELDRMLRIVVDEKVRENLSQTKDSVYQKFYEDLDKVESKTQPIFSKEEISRIVQVWPLYEFTFQNWTF